MVENPEKIAFKNGSTARFLTHKLSSCKSTSHGKFEKGPRVAEVKHEIAEVRYLHNAYFSCLVLVPNKSEVSA